MAIPALQAWSSPTITAVHRRRDRRVKVALPAVIWPAPEEGTRRHNERDGFHVAGLETLSRTGAALTCYGHFEEDDLIWIRFRIGTTTCQLKGVVRHSMLLCGSIRLRSRLGVEFVDCPQTQQAGVILASYLGIADEQSG